MENSIASQIRNNNLKVYFLIALLTAIIGLLGSLISYYFNWGLTGTGSFLIVAGIINFIFATSACISLKVIIIGFVSGFGNSWVISPPE